MWLTAWSTWRCASTKRGLRRLLSCCASSSCRYSITSSGATGRYSTSTMTPWWAHARPTCLPRCLAASWAQWSSGTSRRRGTRCTGAPRASFTGSLTASPRPSGSLTAGLSCCSNPTLEPHTTQPLYRLHPAFAFTLTLILTRLLLLSQRHRSLVDGWQKHKLECRVLCDQLFLNAAARRERLCVRELGPAFNYVGSELRRPAGKRAVLPPPAAACLALRLGLGLRPRLTTRLLTTASPRAQGAHQATLVRAPRRAARRVRRAPHAQGAETVHCRLARAPLARGRRRAAVRPQRLGATGSALAADDARSDARPGAQVQLRGGALPRPVERLRLAAVGRGRQPDVPCGHMTGGPHLCESSARQPARPCIISDHISSVRPSDSGPLVVCLRLAPRGSFVKRFSIYLSIYLSVAPS